MKKTGIILFLTAMMAVTAANAQTKLPPLDKSPMDMAYYPTNFPSLKLKGDPGTLVARVIYSRPQKNGRNIFGELVPLDSVWRLGANEATELDLYQPVTIGGKTLKAGRYTLYAIPQSGMCTIIVNSETDTWGAYGYKAAKDILRTDVPVTELNDPVDAFTMVFEKAGQGANLVIAWDAAEVKLPLKF